jgi:hypothetical protein
MGSRFLVGGFDVSGDINALSAIGSALAPLDVTDITQSAHSRIAGLRDGTMSFTAFFDAANAHPVLSALPAANTLMSFLVPPLAVGSPAACLNALQVSYNPTRSNAGDLTIACEGQGDLGDGPQWCLSLTPGIRPDIAPTTGTTLDNGAATASGAQLFLQVTQFTGTSATVNVTHSPDSSTWTTLATFSAVTAAPHTQTQTVAGAVNRYVRVATTGTFQSLQFAAFVNRNLP